MKLRELTEIAGVTARQVRFLIAEGFVPPPSGGRATAEYGPEHLAALRRYEALRALGFAPAAIRLLLQARQGIPAPIAPGITLVIDPEMIGAGGDIGALTAIVRAQLSALLSASPPAPPPTAPAKPQTKAPSCADQSAARPDHARTEGADHDRSNDD